MAAVSPSMQDDGCGADETRLMALDITHAELQFMAEERFPPKLRFEGRSKLVAPPGCSVSD